MDTRRCLACLKCIGECPHKLLKMVGFAWHRHVAVEQAAACTGCGRCVRACQYHAIKSVL